GFTVNNAAALGWISNKPAAGRAVTPGTKTQVVFFVLFQIIYSVLSSFSKGSTTANPIQLAGESKAV
ncbi:hypothetical protein, partial [Neisseria iguanae]|uniref:hypothetical protein n=1 Tax=Neisseria iguanae TaxID=90242 RepID=UPI001B801EDB